MHKGGKNSPKANFPGYIQTSNPWGAQSKHYYAIKSAAEYKMFSMME